MALGRVIAQRTGTITGGVLATGTLSFYVADHLGSTTARIDAVTGTVVESAQYWPFGSPRTGTTPERAYTGQQKESADTSALGLYYYHARFYSPVLGHFVSADPLTVDGLDRYTYTRNNPVKYADPTGQCVGGLYCSPAIALNILACSGGAFACAQVFYLSNLPFDEARINDAVRFSEAAYRTSEFFQQLFSDANSPFISANYDSLRAGYPLSGAADSLLLSRFPGGVTVADVHDEFDSRFRASDELIAEHENICRGGRCTDATFGSADLALITIGLRSGDPSFFLRVAEASLYTAEVQKHWQAFLAREEPLDAVFWSVSGGFGNLAPSDIELLLFSFRKYAEVLCGSPPGAGCGN